ncbi:MULTISPECIES: universal stress protein [Salinibaculum]|uniref:universal stress protein n=1 Tax=Salinibaculum TaxID=2732368 RepID=UPI0030D5BB5A
MKLLVATDGSDPAENALAYATDIGDATGGQITAVYAVDPAVYERRGSEPASGLGDADERFIIESVEQAEERGLEILEDAVDFCADLGQDIETELLYGDPVSQIAAYAEENGFETIVVGHRGRSEHEEAMLGSVAKSLVERATVPVAVVR